MTVVVVVGSGWPGVIDVGIQPIVDPFGAFCFNEPVLPVIQRLESVVHDDHANVLAGDNVFVLSHGGVGAVHKLGQEVPGDVVRLVRLDPRLVHEFPATLERNQRLIESERKPDSRLDNTVIFFLCKLVNKLGQSIKSTVDIGGIGMERFLRKVASVDLIGRLRTWI